MGSIGGIGINVRYLVHAGIDRADAIRAVALNTVTGVVVHLAGLVVALAPLLRATRGLADVLRRPAKRGVV